jgi:hypothetical protein
MTTITNPLLINYTVTVVSNQYVITWASTLSPVTFDVASASFISRSGNYFDAGDANGALTTLDYTKCTSPSAASKTLLINAITALPSSSATVASTLQVTGLTTAGPVITDSSGNISSEQYLSKVRGGFATDMSGASDGVVKLGAGTFGTGLITDNDVFSSAAISGSKLQAANSTSNAGVVSTGAQTFGGLKTFGDGIKIGGGTTLNFFTYSCSYFNFFM